ncbi:hypothetical protein ACJX0J_027174, partial [Zea mays]
PILCFGVVCNNTICKQEQEQKVNNNSGCYGAPRTGCYHNKIAHHLIYLGLYTLVWHI